LISPPVNTGIESGGHGSSFSPPLLTLVNSILSLLPKDSIPLLGAGGLSNGAHIASLLELGVSGAVLGTRFLLTPESLYTDAQKQALVAAKEGSTVRTLAFDLARDTAGWPYGIDGRGLRNSTVEDIDKGTPIETVRAKYLEGVKAGNTDRMAIWAGTSVGLMNTLQPAAVCTSDMKLLHFRLTVVWRTSFGNFIERSINSWKLNKEKLRINGITSEPLW
jgi:nitronate monooxygenase